MFVMAALDFMLNNKFIYYIIKPFNLALVYNISIFKFY